MFMQKKVGLVAMALASVAMSGTALAVNTASELTATATLQAACEISPTAAIGFGSFPALGSTGNVDATSGSTLTIACSADGVTPGLYAAATRRMTNSTSNVDFLLSLESSGGNQLSSNSASPSAVTLTQDGTAKVVTLYGRIVPGAYQAKTVGAYTGTVAMTVTY